MKFSPIYQQQVALLMKVMPEVSKIKEFALHGGTAINLFLRNLPRLSVDIDLTYVPIEDRVTTLSNIQELLRNLQNSLEKQFSYLKIKNQGHKGKLIIYHGKVMIKIEVNLVKRGCLVPPQKHFLCEQVSESFNAFVAMPMVPVGQVYGGKLCAALDRQHPRDIFDVKNLFENEGIIDEIKIGFLLYLLGGSRPVHEIINPNFKDQRSAFENQFQGMSKIPFSYQDFEATRKQLIKEIHLALEPKDKEFLLSIQKLEPNWEIYDFQRFPSIQWKLQNLRKLKDINPRKFDEQYLLLEKLLEEI